VLKRLLTTPNVKTMVHLLALCTMIISAGAVSANAYDYQAEFFQMADWLTTQQVTSGGNLGGWACSGGIAVWGVLNSYYKENSSGDTWAATAETYMPLGANNGLNNNYKYGPLRRNEK